MPQLRGLQLQGEPLYVFTPRCITEMVMRYGESEKTRSNLNQIRGNFLFPFKDNKSQAARILNGTVTLVSKWKMSPERRSVK